MWKILFEQIDFTTANLIKALLEDNGVEVVIKSAKEFDPVIFGQGGMVQILVKEEDFEKAQQLLKEAQADEQNSSL
ncbi:hypothetical protein Theth_1882 [Pseudothermotoga thermarum DSM 5069]|uniref:DUF2007 domain-containing protein n=1 Tax=Pseudothermotoga thermarum DSM 5069 TaxID=688269 RepID=F7YWE5_9THEM|nr:hypothetical protein Theth_1882 [Pseudothermotoga thermarum DSM 5069]